MDIAVIIVAAGRGRRAGGDMPKQWRELDGKTVARRTLEALNPYGSLILVVHPDDESNAARETVGLQVSIVSGGSDRRQSVKNGLEAAAAQGASHVLIHDVARCCITSDVIQPVIDALATAQAAAPALPVTDALWIGMDNRVTGTKDRNGLYRAQTPQGFHLQTLLSAHRTCDYAAADDVEVATAAGIPVTITQGSENNIKITTPEDFARAINILRGQMDVRLGNGYDVHAFEEGDEVTLCGIKIPHNRALKGHSDADVGMHAVTDALYGALAEGDIGRHFPPSDTQWKGAPSEIFLKHAVDLARQRGFNIGNIDLTLICERPKIGPHSAEMTQRMAEIMSLEANRISIKATTSERLGFTGREEGIAAIATATLVRS